MQLLRSLMLIAAIFTGVFHAMAAPPYRDKPTVPYALTRIPEHNERVEVDVNEVVAYAANLVENDRTHLQLQNAVMEVERDKEQPKPADVDVDVWMTAHVMNELKNKNNRAIDLLWKLVFPGRFPED
ncbi:hypothetical protein BC835DRAFT_1396219 [Cytidiella melzeri]|nr:hypothetical protein BC835DRAFT_1396219 [Cytidiella melzeri]